MRAFITVGPGGVGQSLHLLHREPDRWQARFFMDMNVFHTEDELRKQADTFTCKVNIWGVTLFTTSDMTTLVVLFFFCSNRAHLCGPQVVITGQEAPSTDKRLRKDLFKKVMSGDPVAARLPCAFLTKMVTFHGLEEVRDERETQVPRGDGNDVPVDCETISRHQL